MHLSHNNFHSSQFVHMNSSNHTLFKMVCYLFLSPYAIENVVLIEAHCAHCAHCRTVSPVACIVTFQHISHICFTQNCNNSIRFYYNISNLSIISIDLFTYRKSPSWRKNSVRLSLCVWTLSSGRLFIISSLTTGTRRSGNSVNLFSASFVTAKRDDKFDLWIRMRNVGVFVGVAASLLLDK